MARELAELSARADQVNVRSVTFVATPNAGTPVCSASNLDTFVSQLTNLLTFIPDNPVVDALDTVIALVKHLLVGAYEGIDGVRAMDPDDKRLGALNLGKAPDGVTFYGVGFDVRACPWLLGGARAPGCDLRPSDGRRRQRSPRAGRLGSLGGRLGDRVGGELVAARAERSDRTLRILALHPHDELGPPVG